MKSDHFNSMDKLRLKINFKSILYEQFTPNNNKKYYKINMLGIFARETSNFYQIAHNQYIQQPLQ